MPLLVRQKHVDSSIFISNGDANSAYCLYNMVKHNEDVRRTRIYVLNICNNAAKERYIRRQIAYVNEPYPTLEIRFFEVEAQPEEDQYKDVYELLEKYAKDAIDGYFKGFINMGTDVQIYVPFDKTNYKELDFGEKYNSRMHYPLMNEEEGNSIYELMLNAYGLFTLCAECKNATDDKQWCNQEDCYECAMTRHIMSTYNKDHINGGLSEYIRNSAEDWFDAKMPSTIHELNILESENLSCGCNCGICNPTDKDALLFLNIRGQKKLITRSDMKKIDIMGDNPNIDDINRTEE